MGRNVSQKLIESHLLQGTMVPGKEISLKIDQTLTQDATGTMVMLEFDAMNIGKIKTEISVQYVDHNLIQSDYKNADDHLFLRSACKKFGIWYSRPGNGISHPVHMERFGIPGKTLLGSDSHTPAAGAIGMLATGAGGLEVAMAMAGEPIFIPMPKVMGVKLTGDLPDWVSAKDLILEMLRRHGVDGGLGKIIEYYGPGLNGLSIMDRHVIANMGTELSATSTVFPSDEAVRKFLISQERGDVWKAITADTDAENDEHEEIDLSELEPLIALPNSPGNVVPVSEVAGLYIYQAYIGSSANPGLRDFAIPALMVDGKLVHERISFDINPTSRQMLENLVVLGMLEKLIHSGARIHQAGCNGCIGMGQAPATGKISLRTVPRTLEMPYPHFTEPDTLRINTQMLTPPPDPSIRFELEKGPNIKSLPDLKPLPDNMKAPVLLKVGDDISTDDIMPAGAQVLPFRSNIPELAKFVYSRLDQTLHDRAILCQDLGFLWIGGENYGQGSSREHAALAPRYLGLRAVIAKSFARIHRQNLINFGILPFVFTDSADYKSIEQEDEIELSDIRRVLKYENSIHIKNVTKNETYLVAHNLTEREIDMIIAGSLINLVKNVGHQGLFKY